MSKIKKPTLPTSSAPPLVSIIVPCYNLGQYLTDAINSITAQTFTDYEIIVVDDGSTDQKTKDALFILQTTFGSNLNSLVSSSSTFNFDFPTYRFQLLTKKNGGASSARNYGIQKAQGKYICCLDADDKYHPQFLEKTVAVFENQSSTTTSSSPASASTKTSTTPQTAIVTTYIQNFGKQKNLQVVPDFDPILLALRNPLHSASLFTKAVWQEVGGYTEEITGYEDWDFWLKIIGSDSQKNTKANSQNSQFPYNSSYQWQVVPEPLFHYRHRSNSKVKTSHRRRQELCNQIIDNNHSFYEKNALPIIKSLFQENNHLLQPSLKRHSSPFYPFLKNLRDKITS